MLEKVCEVDGLEIVRYKPTVLKPFYLNMEPMTVMRRIRFLIDLKYGYTVYYLKKGNNFVGCCAITSGKNPRYWFASENDIIIGPYFIEDKYRGKGYCTKLVDAVINRCEKRWKQAYVYILNSNAPSIRTTKKVGGKLLFHVHNTFFRKLIKSERGEYGVYKVSRSK